MMEVHEEIKVVFDKVWQKTFTIFIRTIKESNDINYELLDILTEDYDWYKHESSVGIVIFECFTLLEIIKNAGITEDNYKAQEKKYNHAKKNIKKLSNQNCIISMFPRPSRVIYILKFYLYHYFKISKDITKYIIDEIADKDPISSRMPKNNESLNEEIELINEINDYMFNTHEGKEKWKYFDVSIFSLQEFKEFRSLVYDDDLMNTIIEEEFPPNR